MKYLCLDYLDPQKAEIDAVMSECQPYLEEFHKSDRVILDAGPALEAKCL